MGEWTSCYAPFLDEKNKYTYTTLTGEIKFQSQYRVSYTERNQRQTQLQLSRVSVS
jgi:hypothetical protein